MCHKSKLTFILIFGFLIFPKQIFPQFSLANGGRLDFRMYRDYPGTVFAGVFIDFYAGGNNNLTSDDFGGTNNTDESIFSWADDATNRLAIQRRSNPSEDDVVRLEITQYRVTNYALRFLINNNTNGLFNNFLYPILHDKYLNRYFVMNQTDNVYFYDVLASPSNHPSRDARRFDLVFKIPCEFAASSGTVLLSKNAISTLDRENISNLTENRNNGALILESREKALILPRVANTSAITTPVEGMIIFDLSVNQLKVYDGRKWSGFDYCTN